MTVNAGTTVGDSTGGPFIEIDADPIAVTGSPAFSISGSLTADFFLVTSAGAECHNDPDPPGRKLARPQ